MVEYFSSQISPFCLYAKDLSLIFKLPVYKQPIKIYSNVNYSLILELQLVQGIIVLKYYKDLKKAVNNMHYA